MDENKVLLTQSGIEKLKEEQYELINVIRPKVIEELQLARSQGDLSENADYDAARNRQAEVEARINEIEYMLQHAEIIDEEGQDVAVVRPGVTVTLLDLADNTTEDLTIVGSFETDPKNGKISNESPLAKAILDHEIGEIVTVAVEEPYDVKIINIKLA